MRGPAQGRTLGPMLPYVPEAGIRVLVAGDHALLRHGLRALLSEAGGFIVCGDAADGRLAIQQAARLSPDIVLLDVDLPGLSPVETLRQLKRVAPTTRTLMLGSRASESLLFDFLRAGAAGLLLKDATPAELVRALQDVQRAEFYVSSTVSRKLLDRWHRGGVKPPRRAARVSLAGSGDGPLSDRERQLLEHVAAGLPNRQIAQRLSISVKTVEAHKAHMVAKLGLNGAHDLVRYALLHVQPEVDR